ncbi:thioredoxin domain-containing protein [Iodidimonas gelatinilytica]|uniref:Thioredoxin domain-containing protein n=1 Tax=Iodidimonas gelatinilytica TaxID=1236966 RepID=A0A5A7MPB9_9PROT|nr:thioredoxin domain-containing protein [Iodidimonas gelatinilytica]GEQ97504.1 thioredoxin domain-containing protein [Iodidimonas gelatinilytica]
MTDNRLRFESSPYLLQHADNPVHWRPWGEKALAEAKERNVPILLSVGYAACHWCHVMAHESFENEDIANLMNDLFVNIKVDREERPDLDTIYMSALAIMGQQGGWPLTMFLTPDGTPFWGGTYFPAAASHGRPGFADVLERVSGIYHANPDAVKKNCQSLMAHLVQQNKTKPGQDLAPDMLDQIAEKLFHHMDPRHGGMAGAPKFPQPFLLEFLWRGAIRTENAHWSDAVIRSLDQMALGGLYDHLGGGFARYSVDERWLVPHFEKMLYDNALLVDLYTQIWRETRSDLYKQRVAETMEWVRREMTVESGAFASSLDADSEGEEGKFYVWTTQEIDQHLNADDAALFKHVYDISPQGNWEGVSIPNRLTGVWPLDAETERRLADCRTVLFRERDFRPRPGWDDKTLTDWNGMMIRAACHAGSAFDRSDWLDMAQTAFKAIQLDMSGSDGRLYHSARKSRRLDISLLDDHAHMILAALALYQTTGIPDYLDAALGWCAVVETLFADPQEGGYFTSAKDDGNLILRPKTVRDSAQPSGNGTILECFAQLFMITGDPVWKDRAERLITAFSGEAVGQFFPLLGFLNGYDTLINGVDITLGHKDGTARQTTFMKAVYDLSLPNAVIHDDLSKALPPDSLTICAHQSCSPPLGPSDDLRAAFIKARQTQKG